MVPLQALPSRVARRESSPVLEKLISTVRTFGGPPSGMPVPLARGVRSGIPLYLGGPGRAETGRSRLPHVAHQLKRGFEAVLGLALQWP